LPPAASRCLAPFYLESPSRLRTHIIANHTGCLSILVTISLLDLLLSGDDNDTRGQNREGHASRVAGCRCSQEHPAGWEGLRVLMSLARCPGDIPLLYCYYTFLCFIAITLQHRSGQHAVLGDEAGLLARQWRRGTGVFAWSLPPPPPPPPPPPFFVKDSFVHYISETYCVM